MQHNLRWIIFGAIGLFIALVLLDSLGVFDSKSYYEVPHGSHTHYLAKECDPPMQVSGSPTIRPAPGMTVNCQGQIVPEEN